MTPAQWLFHNRVIVKHRTEEMEESIAMQNALAGEIDYLAFLINSKVAEDYIKTRRSQRMELFDKITSKDKQKEENQEPESIDIDKANIKDDKVIQKIMDEYYYTAPDTITIPSAVANSNRYFLPKFNKEKLKEKKRFIQFESGDN